MRTAALRLFHTAPPDNGRAVMYVTAQWSVQFNSNVPDHLTRPRFTSHPRVLFVACFAINNRERKNRKKCRNERRREQTVLCRPATTTAAVNYATDWSRFESTIRFKLHLFDLLRIARLPDIVVGGLRFYRDSRLLDSNFFVRMLYKDSY